MTLVLDGPLDSDTAPALRQALLDGYEQGCRQLVLDLERVYFLDSTGLGVLVAGLKRFRNGQGNLTLSKTSRHVQQMLVVTGLDKIFDSPEG